MTEQTSYREPPMFMARVTKEDCLTIEQAADELEVSKATLYSYMNVLQVQKLRFPLDRKSYVTKSEIDRIKKFMEENR